MKLNTLQGKKVRNKTVLLRADFNVPIEKETKNHSGSKVKIMDDSRIKDALPTIKYLLRNNNKVIIVSHLGRPKGKNVKSLNLEPIAMQLSKLLKFKIQNSKLKIKLNKFPAYQISENLILLENIRFYPGEEKNDKKFAKELAELADIFVNDAFSVCHRAHASVVGVTKYLPAYAGLDLTKEISALHRIIQNPKRPLVCIIGGAKVETKEPLIRNFLKFADYILIGSKLGTEKIPNHSKKIILPVNLKNNKDINNQTIDKYSKIIKKAKTIFWNGPMGQFEDKKYAAGTKKIAQVVTSSSAFSLVGGGDTIFALKEFGLINKMSYVSEAGGATLEYLAGKKLPGLSVIVSKK